MANVGDELQGYDARLKINGVLFNAKTVKPHVKRTAQRADVLSTGAYEVNRANKIGFSLSVGAFRYSSLNPHAAPFSIMRDEYVELRYWPNKDDVADLNACFYCAEFLITDYSEDTNAESGLQTIDIQGISSGSVFLPGPYAAFPGT